MAYDPSKNRAAWMYETYGGADGIRMLQDEEEETMRTINNILDEAERDGFGTADELTADEAKRMTLESLTGSRLEYAVQMQHDCIRAAAMEGKRECVFQGYVTGSDFWRLVKARLQEEGFQVTNMRTVEELGHRVASIRW